MSFRTWFANLQVARPFDRLQREWRRSPRLRRASYFCLPAEVLEVRSLLSNYTAASVSALVADINAANKSGGANTITLTAPSASPYVLSVVNNATNGANGLPVISGKNGADNLTIIGNGDTIERDLNAGTPAFRLLDVAAGSSLTLEFVTLENGLAQGSGAAADGGGIYNQGSLTLLGATLQNNTAQGTNGADGLRAQASNNYQKQLSSVNGQAGSDAAGGAIWSNGSVTLGADVDRGSFLGNNRALGGNGGAGGILTGVVVGTKPGTVGDVLGSGGVGGSGFGGGLYVAGGSAYIGTAGFITNLFAVDSNTAAGGAGGDAFVAQGTGGVPVFGTPAGGLGGTAAGGGLYVAGGTLNVTSAFVNANQALAGAGGGSSIGSVEVSGNGGSAYGAGIDVAGGTASVTSSSLELNVAQGGTGGVGDGGGFGGNGGNAFGGGLYAGAGTVTLTNDLVTTNEALAGNFGASTASGPGNGPTPSPIPGVAAGGGIEIATAATVSLDSYTVNNTILNEATVDTAGGIAGLGTSNIDGTYTLL